MEPRDLLPFERRLEGGERIDALVAAATPPHLAGPHRGAVQLVFRPPGGAPLTVRHPCWIRYENWLVPGMRVPITIDPADPSRLRVEWDQVPSIGDRLAGEDPALLDPVAARRHVRDATQAAVEAVHAADDPTAAGAIHELSAQLRQMDDADDDTERSRLEAQQLAGPPEAPDGRLRGLAWLLSQTGRGADERDAQRYLGDRLLTIRLPRRAPYATIQRDWLGDARGDLLGRGLPVLVDPSNRDNVEILWDDLPDIREQAPQRVASGLERAARQHDELQRQQLARTFAAIPDPQQRRVLADQLRAQGMTIDEAWLAPPQPDERRKKLAALRDSGVLTQAEYDAQLARLTD